MKTIKDYRRCDVLLVPTRAQEIEYVIDNENSVESYDKLRHIIYLNNRDPIIVVTMKSKLIDGWNKPISRVGMFPMLAYSIDDITMRLKELDMWIKDINGKSVGH